MKYCCENEKCRVELDSCGGMLFAAFKKPDREIHPLFERAWGSDADEFMSHLRGEFMATPFGAAPEDMTHFPEVWQCVKEPVPDGYAHGEGAHLPWTLVEQGEDTLYIEAVYTEGAIEKVRKYVRLDRERFAVHIEDELWIAEDDRLPLGLHPMFALAKEPGKTRILPPEAEAIWTYPVPLEESSILLPDSAVEDLGHVPDRKGNTRDMRRLPLPEETENLLMLCKVKEGRFRVVNEEADYTVELRWDTRYLQHCVLWFSNRGRAYAPWNGQNVCLGVEPVTSAFDLGTAISQADNPLRQMGYETAYPVHKGQQIRLQHEICLL